MVERPARRILVIAHEVRSDGGMERAMMQTLVGLLDQGWKVRLLARVCEIEDQPGLRWTRIPTLRRPGVLAFPLFALVAGSLAAAFRRSDQAIISLGAIVPNRVDVTTVQFCHAGFVRHGIRRASRDSWIWRAHESLAQQLALASERWCYRPGRVKRMTAVSDLIKQELQAHYELGSVPIDVIANGVDTKRFHPDAVTRERERRRLAIGEDELVAVFVGGDWRRKGLDVAIEAVTRANWTLLVVGGDDDLPAWEGAARARGARVHFCGHVSEPELVLCAADAFILPSRYEGFALVTIEAAAAGLPLLVTASTGAGRLAERTGRKALPNDAGAFAAELEWLGTNPDLRRETGLRARTAAEELTWPRIVEAYSRAYALEGPQS